MNRPVLLLSALLLAGCTQTQLPDAAQAAQDQTALTTAQRDEQAFITASLNDENTADDQFMHMVQAAGGFDAYEQKLNQLTPDELVAYHKTFNLTYVDLNRTLGAQAISSCVKFFPASDRNLVYFLGSHTTYIDSVGRPSYSSLSWSAGRTFTAGTRTACQTTVGTWGVAGDVGGHLVASSLGGYGGRANLVPQNGTMNLSTWRRVENKVRLCALSYTGSFRATANYASTSTVRPSSLRASLSLSRYLLPVVSGAINMPNRVPTTTDTAGTAGFLANYTPYCG